MSLQGHAFLALWNDVAPGHENEYDAWHTREHVPERVGVPGILAGRRYAATADSAAGAHRYLTLYELTHVAVLDSAPYRQLVQHPTPWSAAMRPRLLRFVRAACVTRTSTGAGVGGALVALRLPRSFSNALPEVQLDLMLRGCAELTGVTGVHWGAVDADAAAPQWMAGAAVESVAAVVLIECYGSTQARQVQAEVVAQLAQAGTTCSAAAYELRYLCDRRLGADWAQS